MKMCYRFLVIATLLISSLSAHAQSDGPTNPARDSVSTTFFPTYSLFTFSRCFAQGDDCRAKIILDDAREDAATFIATEGQARGVRLEKALNLIRHANPEAQVSDLEIAMEILSVD